MDRTHDSTVKMVAETDDTFTVGGYGACWGGRDIEGEYFTPETDFWFDRITETPMVLYGHGLDGKMTKTVIGRVETKNVDDYGLWIEAQIKANESWSDAVRGLVNKGVLGWSSGAVNHLVTRVKKGGAIWLQNWPTAEWSLVPNPCEPRALGVQELESIAKSSPAFKSVVEGIKVLEEGSDDAGGFLANGKAKPSSGYDTSNNSVGASGKGDFAYVDSNGRGHLPIGDEGHVRAALSRFSQTRFESPAKKKAAARKILAKARSMSIDVSDDSAVAMAAKATNLKDLPAGPTLLDDMDGGPYPEGSYEDLADDIGRQLQQQTGSYAWVRATMAPDCACDGYALVCVADDDCDDAMMAAGLQNYRVAYTIGDDGEPDLGAMEQVHHAMAPSEKALELPVFDEAPLAIQAARLSDYATLVLARTQGVQERRIKEGRVLSTSNRDRLSSTADALEGALKAIRDLLDSTEPQPAKAASMDRNTRRLREIEALKLWGAVALA